MRTTGKSGADALTSSRQSKSFINVKMFEPVNKKFTISSESDSLLSSYVDYLNSSLNKKFNVDAVIEALIDKLNEDKNFKTWLKKNNPENNQNDHSKNSHSVNT